MIKTIDFTTTNQPLPPCPSCGHATLKTIESRKTNLSTRRRKECNFCGYRTTTHELTDEKFNELKTAYQLLNRIKDILQVQSEVLTTSTSNSNSIPCSTCKHNSGFTCSFDFPEYDSPDAIDCIHHTTLN